MSDADQAFEAARARLVQGTSWKASLEELLLALDPDDASHLQQVLREARGSWLGLLHASAGRALVVGDPLSGTVIALARAGFDVVVADENALRLALCRARGVADVDGLAYAGRIDVLCAHGAGLPCADASFDLVVIEGDPKEEATREALRVGTGEVVLIAENRFAYKRWSGRHGAFHVPGPIEFLRAALDPRRPERSLTGYRRRLSAAGVVSVRAFALYPHALDFALLAGLDGSGPELFVGPKERENVPKMIGYRLGLLPWAAPSFALLASRTTGPSRMARVLDALAKHTGESRQRVRQWISSRGNTSVVQTDLWTVHVPHQPYQERQAGRHFARLGELRASFPDVPVPEPLFAGRLEGLPVFCERRIEGLTAPQAVGRHELLARTYHDTARHLASLVVEPDAVFDEVTFDELLRTKFDLVRRYAAVKSTIVNLDRMCEEARERLAGRHFPRVIYHADLRSKHVVLDHEGGVRAYLDWGSSEASDLPYFDLLHLIVHERKQEAGSSAGAAWQLLARPDGLRPAERAALDDYATLVGLTTEVRKVLEAIYPVLVAAMAEKNWDYSRPRWLHDSFGL